jgi:hypothetical protein
MRQPLLLAALLMLCASGCSQQQGLAHPSTIETRKRAIHRHPI